MLSQPPWMQPSPQGKAQDLGTEPQIQTLHVDIAAGVFSETLNYIQGVKIRPENFCSTK